MAKTPSSRKAVSSTRHAPQHGTKSRTRPTRAVSTVSFANAGESDEMEDENGSREDEDDSSDDTSVDIRVILGEMQKRQAKKASARSAAFQGLKNNVYANARKSAQELVRECTAAFEDVRATIDDLRRQEVSFEQQVENLRGMYTSADEQAQRIQAIYPQVFEDLFARRSKMVNAASALVQENPQRHKEALDTFLVTAHDQVAKSQAERKTAADASKLIRHYKDLLRAA